MILGHRAILEAIKDGKIVVDPFDPHLVGPNSLDFGIGREFFCVKYIHGEPVFYGPMEFNAGTVIHLPMAGVLLALTDRVIGTAAGENMSIVARMQARSSTGRRGIVICNDAGIGDVGYIARWTMEITANCSGASIVVGEIIGQMIFEYVLGAKPYDGQYTKDVVLNMVPSKYRKSNVVAAPGWLIDELTA